MYIKDFEIFLELIQSNLKIIPYSVVGPIIILVHDYIYHIWKPIMDI